MKINFSRYFQLLLVGTLVACGVPTQDEPSLEVAEPSRTLSSLCAYGSSGGCQGQAIGSVCWQTGTCQLNPSVQQYFPGACHCPGGTPPPPPTCPSNSLDGCANQTAGTACVSSTTGGAGTCGFRQLGGLGRETFCRCL